MVQSKNIPWCVVQVFKGKDSPLTLDWSRVRVFDREVGQMFVNLAKTSKEAKVGASLIILFCPVWHQTQTLLH